MTYVKVTVEVTSDPDSGGTPRDDSIIVVATRWGDLKGTNLITLAADEAAARATAAALTPGKGTVASAEPLARGRSGGSPREKPKKAGKPGCCGIASRMACATGG